jgi:hypothetical protein
MGIEETAETWVRIDLFCDGIGNDGICAGDPLERISDVAATAEGVRKAILNAAVKAPWRFDSKLQRWLCPECVRAHDGLEQTEDVEMTYRPPSVPHRRSAPDAAQNPVENQVYLFGSAVPPAGRHLAGDLGCAGFMRSFDMLSSYTIAVAPHIKKGFVMKRVPAKHC